MTFTNQDLLYGAFAGSIPTVSMLLTSLIGVEANLSPTFQASAQNLCAGLILGAVAKELFPQINAAHNKDNLFGVTIGFFVGLFFVNFLDYVVDWFENRFNQQTDAESQHLEMKSVSDYGSYQSVGSGDDAEVGGIFAGRDRSSSDSPIIHLAHQAVSSPIHRDKIRQKVADLVHSIESIEEKSNKLLISGSPKSGLSVIDEETYADQIDEEIHKLQYNLDHCRRLIQGCESNIVGVVPRLWITVDGKSSLRDGLEDLKQGANSLVKFLEQEVPDKDSLIEIHKNMAVMDNQITQLHDTVEEYSFKWGRRGHKGAISAMPQSGSFIPLGLIIPVTVDCIVDGFLVGTTCSISHSAGMILALANCIEMGFLGLAVSMRIRKCTGSSVSARYCVLIFPPLIMMFSSILGAMVGAEARSHQMLYIGFISFGIVALLYLVVNELLVEAREALEGNESWWSGMVIFVGIYCVLILDMFV